MSDYWMVILAVDKAPIRGLIEGVVPASYKPPSTATWAMCKADTKEEAIKMAIEGQQGDLGEGETLAVASVARWCDEGDS